MTTEHGFSLKSGFTKIWCTPNIPLPLFWSPKLTPNFFLPLTKNSDLTSGCLSYINPYPRLSLSYITSNPRGSVLNYPLAQGVSVLHYPVPQDISPTLSATPGCLCPTLPPTDLVWGTLKVYLQVVNTSTPPSCRWWISLHLCPVGVEHLYTSVLQVVNTSTTSSLGCFLVDPWFKFWQGSRFHF